MPVTVGRTSPIAGNSRRKQAARKKNCAAARQQAERAMGAVAAKTPGETNIRVTTASQDATITACRTQTKHGGSVTVPMEAYPAKQPCASAAQEAVEEQLCDLRRRWRRT